MANGYIKTFRKFTEWEWYRNTNTKALFLHCLLKANHKPKKWQGITIPQGSFVTSYAILAEELGLSMQEIRTAKRNIQSTGEITSESTSKLTIITVLNWAKYQASDNDESTSESTSDIIESQQTSNKQATTTKNIENIRIQEEENIEDKSVVVATASTARFIKPTIEEVMDYCQERQNFVDPEKWYDHYSSNGWKVGGRAPMKDWKAAVRTWEKNGFNNGNAKDTAEQDIARRVAAVERMYNPQ